MPGAADQSQAEAMACQQITTSALTTVLLLFSLVPLGSGTFQRVLAGLVACLISATLWSLDRRGVLASWEEAGDAEIARASGRGGRSGVARIASATFRVALAAINGGIVAVLLLLRIFGADISNEQSNRERLANAALQSEVAANYKAALTDKQARVKDAESELADLAAERRGVSPGGADGLLASDLLRLNAVSARRDQIEAEQATETRLADVEVAGVKTATSTGVLGEGPVAKFHARQAERLGRELAALDQEAAALRSEVSRLEDERRARSDGKTAAALDPRERAAEARQEAAAGALADFRQGEPSWKKAQAEADPRWQSARGSLLSDMDALLAILQRSPALAAFALSLKLALIMLEANVALGKLLTPPRGRYAIEVAADLAMTRAKAAAGLDRAEFDAEMRSSLEDVLRERTRPETQAVVDEEI